MPSSMGTRVSKIFEQAGIGDQLGSMFKRRTLFIVGAGASAEVHLPAGAKLARTIGERLDVRFSDSGSTGDQLLFEQFRARYQHK